MNRFLYFAYGSNLSTERIRILNKTAQFKAIALLKKYRLEFVFNSPIWGGSAANIIPDPKSHVYGVLWELEESDLANLDIQEGVKHRVYQRAMVDVEVAGKEISCLAYEITQETRQKSIEKDGEAQKPSNVYKTVIVTGAKEHNLPPEYIIALESIEDNGYNGPVDLTKRL